MCKVKKNSQRTTDNGQQFFLMLIYTLFDSSLF